jgi:2-polyprenyl-3-methyl-5-hydroxy-6-metoxy-1,4-benzoquinol methylase
VRITDSNYGQTAALNECSVCGFRFAAPPPHDDLLALYSRMEDPSYQASSKGRRVQMRALLDVIAAARPQARTLVDIGAGTGLLVTEARARGLDATGIEPSQWCVATAASENNVDLLHGTTRDWIARLPRFDVVTLVDVIEHTTDPVGVLRDAASLLAPGGVVLIVTPDVGSFAARLMGRWWWHYRVAHVGYFTRASMRRALREAGLVLDADVLTGWRFPASYVAERLVRYVPVFPFSTILRAAAGWAPLQRFHITVNLGDSRAFVASAVPA